MTPSNSEIILGFGVDTCGDRGGIMRDVRSEHPVQDPLDLLVERGADCIEHPGGTLLDHLGRVATLLEGWGATDEVQRAGLCHACYGTDGFAPSLLGLDERGVLAARIGRRAEAWVYLYASCDREVVYPALGSRGSLWFRDRFTGECSMLGAGDAAVLVELTAANELDIVTVNPAWGAQRDRDCSISSAARAIASVKPPGRRAHPRSGGPARAHPAHRAHRERHAHRMGTEHEGDDQPVRDRKEDPSLPGDPSSRDTSRHRHRGGSS